MRTRPLSKTPAVVLGVLVLLALSVGPLAVTAGAQEPITAVTSEIPTLTSAAVDAGGSETVSGGGCVARAQVQIQLDGVVLVTTRSSSTGRYKARLVVPVSTTPGSHKITVVCAGPSGQLATEAAVTVNLPNTGLQSQRELALGLAMVAFGAAMMVAARLRANAHPRTTAR